MTDPTPDEVAAAVRAAYLHTTALLTAALKQVAAEKGTPEHAAGSREMHDAAARMLQVKHLNAETALIAQTRLDASLIKSLSERSGVDIAGVLERLESGIFFEDNL